MSSWTATPALSSERHGGVVNAQPSGLGWFVLSFLALPAFAVIPISFTDTRYLAMPQEAAVAAALADVPVEQRSGSAASGRASGSPSSRPSPP